MKSIPGVQLPGSQIIKITVDFVRTATIAYHFTVYSKIVVQKSNYILPPHKSNSLQNTVY